LAINKRKILESAQRNLQKGLLDKALEDYRTLLKADPHDSNVLLKLGDLYLKQGKKDESINAYLRVAQQFTRDGFDAKAVALYKQISRLDPKRHDVSVPLAELYGRMGLVSDAIASLQTAADAAYRAGHKDDALELLRRMAALDPSNTVNRLKVAELLAQENRRSEALAEYDAVAEELGRRGEEEERLKVIDRILALDPTRVDALREAGRAKLAANQFAAAKKLAERMVGAHPDDLDGHELLGHALLGAGETDRAREVFRDLAERFRLRGDEDRARDLMQRFGGLDALAPDESDPRLDSSPGLLELESEVANDELLVDEASPLPPPKTPLARIEPVQAPKRVAQQPAPPKPAPAPPKPAAPAPPAPRPQLLSIDPESTDPGQLLAEATVYLRYGKHERAVGALRAILAKEPGHRPALEQLGEALAALGETSHAVTAWQRAAEAAHEAGDTEGLARVRGLLAKHDPAAAEALGGAAPEPADPAVLEDFEVDLDIDDGELDAELGVAPEPTPAPATSSIEIGTADDDGLAGDAAMEDPAAWSPAAEAKPAPTARGEVEEPTATTPAQLAEQLEEAEFYLEQGMLEEARGLYEAILSAAPNHPQAMLRLGEIAAKAGKPVTTPAPVPAAKSPAPAPKSPAPVTAKDPVFDDEDPFATEIDVELPEAPAPSAPLPVAAAAPAVVAPPAPDTTQPSFEDMPTDGGDFDLAAELSGIGDDDAPVRTLAGTEEEGFEQVFNAFKSGVDRELGEDDHEARYDLGIAYKEMGLLEDAIGEFRIAMQIEARKLSCLHMLALCALDLGRSADAVAHLEQALSLPALPDDQRVPLEYDLARAYAAQGDVARARAGFEAVRKADPTFGDVERELAALATKKLAKAAEPAEAYESFDDLLAEDTGTSKPAEPPTYESFEDLFSDDAEPAAAAGPADFEADPATDVELDPEPEPAPEPAPPPPPEPAHAREPDPPPASEPEPAPAAGKKRRKISFV